MARRDRHDDFDERPRRRSPLIGILAGMVWGIILFGGGLVVLNELADPPKPPDTGRAAAGGGASATGGEPDRSAATADRPTGGPVESTDSKDAGTDDRVATEDGRTGGPKAADDGAAKVSPRIGDLLGPSIPISGPAIEVNARPFADPGQAGLLAVVLYGGERNGLSPETLAAVSMPLTLALRPDRADHLRLARSARDRGHEVLAVLPLATGDTIGLSARDSADQLEVRTAETLIPLSMAVGAVAPDGATILDKPEAMSALLKPVTAHSFLWVEPRASSRSAAARLAFESDLIFIQANVFVAPGASAEDVYRSVGEAARQAHIRGTAVIFVEASQQALRGLVSWAFEKSVPGVVFAPISAIARKRKKG